MNPRGFPPRRPRIRENVNEAIRAREVRAVFPDGSVEVMPTLAAVRRAQDLGLDLILIAPTAEPPVAKAMDYGQWQYENKKKQHDAKRKQHIIQGKKLLLRFAGDLAEYGVAESQPRLEGRNAHVMVSPVKAAVPVKEKSEKPK